ncbi:MAG: Holliday junction resolvase RecU [Vallitalea sp.]|jgi:recombination protein U|nr:Holliday junction resolvase RecU [Vallitalea sp.]
MAYWNSRGLRGNTLEELINYTNTKYREKGLALIQKIPTPIKPIKIDEKSRHISLAYFEQKSTVDYIGVVQGIAVCFDAKETTKEILPLQNIHEHQIMFMRDFVKQGGIAFFLVYFSKHNEYFYLPYEQINVYWENAKIGGRKSIPYKDMDRNYIISNKDGVYIHYLEQIKRYVESN